MPGPAPHICTGRGPAEYFPQPAKAGLVNVFSTLVNRDKPAKQLCRKETYILPAVECRNWDILLSDLFQ
ncbi:hypothetical protein J6590_096347 [Homalodisca vitripennis]|nr:hypothetical protein J6590_096347 [Homalodisca vitripennis]